MLGLSPAFAISGAKKTVEKKNKEIRIRHSCRIRPDNPSRIPKSHQTQERNQTQQRRMIAKATSPERNAQVADSGGSQSTGNLMMGTTFVMIVIVRSSVRLTFQFS